MHTALMPLDGNDFDLDSGVYLQGYSTDQYTWPSINEVHNWVYDGVKNHTNSGAEKGNACIRVVYADAYHIDFPIYIMGEENGQEVAFLAHKVSGWTLSDPKAFTQWFQDAVNTHGTQLRNVVKYLKAWNEYKEVGFKSIALTILVAEEFKEIESRDDKSLLETVIKIIDRLEKDFSCYKPVMPKDEDVLSGHSYFEKIKMINSLKEVKNTLHTSIYHHTNDKDATELVQTLFGSRFPVGKNNESFNNEFSQTNQPEQIGRKNRHFA